MYDDDWSRLMISMSVATSQLEKVTPALELVKAHLWIPEAPAV